MWLNKVLDMNISLDIVELEDSIIFGWQMHIEKPYSTQVPFADSQILHIYKKRFF